MIMYEYVYRDRKLGCGAIPQYQNIDKEHMAEGVKRQLLTLTDVEKKRQMADLELLYIGTYDDVLIKHDNLDSPELILTCGDYITTEVVEKE